MRTFEIGDSVIACIADDHGAAEEVPANMTASVSLIARAGVSTTLARAAGLAGAGLNLIAYVALVIAVLA